MFYILFGPNDLSLHEELIKIKERLGGSELLESNITTFEAKQLTPNQLIDVCSAMPFLGAHRLVIVEGLLKRCESSSGPWLTLKDFVGAMPPTTVLVLIDGGVKDNPLLKELRPLASVKEFPMLRGTALTGWIQRRVTANGGSISARAAKMLAELAGDDLWVLSGEVEKLVLYALGRRIEEEDVRKVASAAREFNVFAMVDALVEGRAVVATRALHQLLEEGMTAPHILSMITRQLRIMLQGKELSLSRIPAPEIKKRLSMASPYAVTKALEQSRRYSLERLEQVYRKLLDTDLAIKRGVWKGELALDLLVVELCA